MGGDLPKVPEMVSGSPRGLAADPAVHCSAAETNSPHVVVTYAGSVELAKGLWNHAVLGSNCGPAHLVALEPLG